MDCPPANFDACVGTTIRRTGRNIWVGGRIWLRRVRAKVLDLDHFFELPAKPIAPSAAALRALRSLKRGEQILAFLDHVPLRQASLFDLTVWTDWGPSDARSAADILVACGFAHLTIELRNRCEHRIVRLPSSPLAIAPSYAAVPEPEDRKDAGWTL